MAAMKIQGGRMVPQDSQEVLTARKVDAALVRLQNMKHEIYRQTSPLRGPEGDAIRRKLNTVDQAILEAIDLARRLSKNPNNHGS